VELLSAADVTDCIQKVQTLRYAEEACYNGTLIIKACSSGLEIGTCNWTINGPKRDVAFISSSIFLPAHAMKFDYHALQGNDVILYSDFSPLDAMEDVEDVDDISILTTDSISTLRYYHFHGYVSYLLGFYVFTRCFIVAIIFLDLLIKIYSF
jgi:integrator complex subunit 9